MAIPSRTDLVKLGEVIDFRIANFEGAKLNLAIPNSTFKVGGLRPFCRFADAGENGQKFARFLK